MRNLAEIKIIDLIASVRKYAYLSSRVRLFGKFCGILNIQHL